MRVDKESLTKDNFNKSLLFFFKIMIGHRMKIHSVAPFSDISF